MSENYRDDDKTRTYIPLTEDTMVGHYRIVGKIGSGGMGEVYLAEDTELNRKVALKFLSPHLCQDADCRARFKREAQAIAQLDHPNIVTIYEVSEFNGQPFFAMYYVAGHSLKDIIGQEAAQPAYILRLTRDICEGLRAAHAAGIIHRDIKPANILVQKDGKAKIVDFGLAAVAGSDKLTQPGFTFGTLSYMSPEQLQGKTVDARSDLFSLGVVLYEMITGKTPFQRERRDAVAFSILHDTPEPLDKHAKNIPRGWQEIVSRLLQKSPDSRYQSAAELLHDLEVLDSAGLSPSALQRRPKRRRTRLLWGLAVLVALIATAIIIKPWRLHIYSGNPEMTASYRLAVLYLKNLGVPGDEYLSYGITEDLIVDLTRIGTIGVTPMRYVMKYRESDIDPKAIAEQLNVNLILDGSIQKTGEVIRISVQLMNPDDGTNLWADRWEEKYSNLSHIKEALARGISRALNIDATTIQDAQVGQPEGLNAVAYDYYLRGKYTFENREAESDVDIALGLYRKALETEPSLLAARIGVAEILSYKGEHEGADEELMAALKEARSRNLKADEARALMGLAKSYENQRVDEKARSYGDSAAIIARQLGDLDGELTALWVLRDIFQRQQNYHEAIAAAERMVHILHRLNDREREAEELKHIGSMYFLKGEFDQALSFFRQGLVLAQDIGKRDWEASLTHNIGMCFSQLGSIDSALQFAERALSLYIDLGDKTSTAQELYSIGASYTALGDYRVAKHYFDRAGEEYGQIGDEPGGILAQYGIGASLMNLGQYDSAITILNTVLNEFIRGGDTANMISVTGDLGLTYCYLGEPERAKPYMYKALEYAQQSLDTSSMAFNCWCLAELYYFDERYDSSKHYSELSVGYARAAGDRDMELLSSAYLASTAVRGAGTLVNRENFDQIIDELRQRGDMENVIIVQRLFGQVLVDYGETDEDHRRGRMILQEALRDAEQRGLVHESGRIRTILKGEGDIL